MSRDIETIQSILPRLKMRNMVLTIQLKITLLIKTECTIIVFLFFSEHLESLKKTSGKIHKEALIPRLYRLEEWVCLTYKASIIISIIVFLFIEYNKWLVIVVSLPKIREKSLWLKKTRWRV